MRSKSTLVLMVVFLFAAVQSVQADFDVYGTGHYDVLAPHSRGRLYDFSSADVLQNGQIGNAYVYDSALLNVIDGLVVELYTRDGSSANISGGRTIHLHAEMNSVVNLLSGANVGGIRAWDNSTVNIFDNTSSGGGDVLYAYGNSTVNIYGGRVNDIYSYSGSSTTFYGYNFVAMDGLSLVDGYVLGTGRLTGNWFNGAYFSADILENTGTIMAVSVAAPVADAGPDQTVFATGGIAQVTLDGSGSSDPDGNELTYEWTWSIGEDTYNATGINPTIELPIGEHTIQLIVNDGTFDSEPDYVEITILNASLSGWVWMGGSSDIGYSLDEGDLLCFFSWEFVMSFNLDTGEWLSRIPMGWFFVDWPFYYELDTGASWFALPPEFGLWVYHYSTDEWTVLPRIIP